MQTGLSSGAQLAVVSFRQGHDMFDVRLAGRGEALPGVRPVDLADTGNDLRLHQLRIRILVPIIGCAADVWQRFEAAARDRDTTANRLLAKLATQWLKNREWPSTDVQIQVARASLFTAQPMVRDMAAAAREKEIANIRHYISTIVPDLPSDSSAANHTDVETTAAGEEAT